jgi:hypothetical protein
MRRQVSDTNVSTRISDTVGKTTAIFNNLKRDFFSMVQQPLVGQGLLIVEASRSHSDTPHSVGLLRTSDQPDARTSTWQHTTLTRDRYPCTRRGFEPAIPASERPQAHAFDRAATGVGFEDGYSLELQLKRSLSKRRDIRMHRGYMKRAANRVVINYMCIVYKMLEYNKTACAVCTKRGNIEMQRKNRWYKPYTRLRRWSWRCSIETRLSCTRYNRCRTLVHTEYTACTRN